MSNRQIDNLTEETEKINDQCRARRHATRTSLMSLNKLIQEGISEENAKDAELVLDLLPLVSIGGNDDRG